MENAISRTSAVPVIATADHRTAGFLRDLQASLFKRKKLCDIVVRISRSFREDPDGDTIFHLSRSPEGSSLNLP